MLSPANYEVLKRYCAGAVPVGPAGTSERERWLIEEKYLEPHETGIKNILDMPAVTVVSYHITARGLDAIAEFEKERNAETIRKKQQRFDNKIAVANVLVPTLTFILGLIVEHYAGIIEWLLALF